MQVVISNSSGRDVPISKIKILINILEKWHQQSDQLKLVMNEDIINLERSQIINSNAAIHCAKNVELIMEKKVQRQAFKKVFGSNNYMDEDESVGIIYD